MAGIFPRFLKRSPYLSQSPNLVEWLVMISDVTETHLLGCMEIRWQGWFALNTNYAAMADSSGGSKVLFESNLVRLIVSFCRMPIRSFALVHSPHDTPPHVDSTYSVQVLDLVSSLEKS